MRPIVIIPIVIVLIILFNAVYTVDQRQQVLVLQFGEPVGLVTDPGLHFKIPLVQNVVYFDNRILELNAKPKEVVIKDNTRKDAKTALDVEGISKEDSARIIVDAFVKYKITDPLEFYKSVRTEAVMQQRLNTHLDSSLREVLGGVSLRDVLTGRRGNVMHNIHESVKGKSKSFGITVVDVRIMRSDLPAANRQSVYRRMQARYEQVAKEYRAKGEEEAQRITARAEKERTIILAEADRTANVLRGEGEATATKIFADAFGKDTDFFSFYRSMQAYRETLNKDDTTMVLSPDSEFLRFFGDEKGKLPAR